MTKEAELEIHYKAGGCCIEEGGGTCFEVGWNAAMKEVKKELKSHRACMQSPLGCSDVEGEDCVENILKHLGLNE